MMFSLTNGAESRLPNPPIARDESATVEHEERLDRIERKLNILSRRLDAVVRRIKLDDAAPFPEWRDEGRTR